MNQLLTHPILLLTVGGAAGTNARYWFGMWIRSMKWVEEFPLATVLINLTGSLLLGIFAALFPDRSYTWYVLLGVGFCGGYTTFSTFALETYELMRRGHHGIAALNVAISVVASVVAVWLAIRVMEKSG
jgi:CrcB protein